MLIEICQSRGVLHTDHQRTEIESVRETPYTLARTQSSESQTETRDTHHPRPGGAGVLDI